MDAPEAAYRVRWTVEIRGEDEEGETRTLETGSGATPREAALQLTAFVRAGLEQAGLHTARVASAMAEALTQTETFRRGA